MQDNDEHIDGALLDYHKRSDIVSDSDFEVEQELADTNLPELSLNDVPSGPPPSKTIKKASPRRLKIRGVLAALTPQQRKDRKREQKKKFKKYINGTPDVMQS